MSTHLTADGLTFHVDDEDDAFVSTHRWTCVRGDYPRAIICGRHVFLHKALLGISDRTPVDHINRDTLDCRRQNLRPCTHAQNMRNRGSGGNKTGYRRVTRVGGGFRAEIVVDYKAITSAVYGSAIEAAMIYDVAAKEMHGAFASPNFSADRDWIFIFGDPGRTQRTKRAHIPHPSRTAWPPEAVAVEPSQDGGRK